APARPAQELGAVALRHCPTVPDSRVWDTGTPQANCPPVPEPRVWDSGTAVLPGITSAPRPNPAFHRKWHEHIRRNGNRAESLAIAAQRRLHWAARLDEARGGVRAGAHAGRHPATRAYQEDRGPGGRRARLAAPPGRQALEKSEPGEILRHRDRERAAIPGMGGKGHSERSGQDVLGPANRLAERAAARGDRRADHVRAARWPRRSLRLP